MIVLGNFNGRLDHSMAMIHVLIMWESIFSNLLVISPECITFLLHAGLNKIHINTQYEGRTCGLIPFCIILLNVLLFIIVPCDSITTTGLKWDMTNWKTSFNTIISSCNILSSDLVTVEVSNPIIWTITFKLSEFKNKLCN